MTTNIVVIGMGYVGIPMAALLADVEDFYVTGIQRRSKRSGWKIDFLHPIFKHQMHKYADKIIAISHDNSSRIGIPEKTEIIYNYAEISKKKQNLASYESKRFLYLGGSLEIKGFYTSLWVEKIYRKEYRSNRKN